MEIKQIRFTLLPLSEWRVFKAIWVHGKHAKFSGHLLYSRNYEKTMVAGDELDQKILEEVTKIYPESYVAETREIMWEGQQQEFLTRYTRSRQLNFSIILFPTIVNIDHSNLKQYDGMDLPLYTLPVTIHHDVNLDQHVFPIYDNVTLYLDHTTIPGWAKTISSV